jgi:signal transduction histidine kinase
MTSQLQYILDLIRESNQLSDDHKATFEKALKDADKTFEIINFKLDRTEKVKRTTAILLEETIQELELKRKAIEDANELLQQSLADLKAAQSQLIQSEKMASLGELTAGIAHEIQNPLNFVNNFSEVSAEILEEVTEEINNGNINAAISMVSDLKENLIKINHHGQRASSIIRSMLEHSRKSDTEKSLTDINALCDEYIRLAYHACLSGRQGLRAKDKSFNAEYTLDLDPSLPNIMVIPQDISRVILNIINNAFFAVRDVQKPLVKIKTFHEPDKVIIKIIDNGIGIPIEIKDKIFQPFFTTKPTGQGTGLGLSLAYDIVTKGHGGTIEVEISEDKNTVFTIQLPISDA